jgi:hypothetical protein
MFPSQWSDIWALYSDPRGTGWHIPFQEFQTTPTQTLPRLHVVMRNSACGYLFPYISFKLVSPRKVRSLGDFFSLIIFVKLNLCDISLSLKNRRTFILFLKNNIVRLYRLRLEMQQWFVSTVPC